ncbi:MAG TPA: stalk domain-containing protein [Syntrophomonadaceae bacterium]|nr:stalk domain-containing protein [Syntrophomonadaceae bacterium]
MCRRRIFLLLILLLILGVPVSTVQAAPAVVLNGQQLSFDVPPVIENGRTLVPLRAIFEAIGATVNWDDATQTVSASKGETSIQLKIGETSAIKNGTKITLDVPAMVIEGRSMVPLRFVVEAFDGVVGFDSEKGIITIHSNQKPSADIVWSRTFSEDCGIMISNMQETSDGGYMICGTKIEKTDKQNIFMLKTDSMGIKKWDKVVTEGSPDWGAETEDGFVLFEATEQSQIITADKEGNFVASIKLAGYFNFASALDGYILYSGSRIFRYSINDEVIWEKNLPNAFIVSVLETEDGFMVLSVDSNGSFGGKVYLWKLNEKGSIMWKKSYFNGQAGLLSLFLPCSDSGYLLSVSDAAETNSGCRTIKIDADGSVEWERYLGGAGGEIIIDAVETEDGYVLAGSTDSFGAGESDSYLVKLDLQGDLQWEKTIGSKYSEHIGAIWPASDGSIVIAVRGESGGDSFDKIYLVKLRESAAEDETPDPVETINT